VIALTVLTSGCLSLGGETTFVADTPETTGRIASLEARVGALEQALGRPSPPPVQTTAPSSF
jgi:hypothetical protein